MVAEACQVYASAWTILLQPPVTFGTTSDPHRPQRRLMNSAQARPHPLTTCLFAVGAALALTFVPKPAWIIGALALLMTAIWIASQQRHASSQPHRAIGWLCTAIVATFHLLWVYAATSFGVLLAWTPDRLSLIVVIALACGWLLTAQRPLSRVKIPMVVPLGAWIALILSGWLREENLLRCDDFLALQAPVELILPSHPELSSCRPGEVRPAGRFPRTIWQGPDDRIIFTTQGTPIAGGIDGSVCQADLGSSARPQCVGRPSSKSQGIIDLEAEQRLLVLQWGILTPDGRSGSVAMEIPREGDLTVLAEHWFPEMFGDGFYSPQLSTLSLFSDRNTETGYLFPVHWPDLARQPAIPMPIIMPAEIHVDSERGEGIVCGTPMGAAIVPGQLPLRGFGTSAAGPIERVSLSWGCDWDPASRKAFIAVPNFGLLDRVDFDSGAVEKRWFIGPGARSVAYDARRRRIYLTDFLRGYVVAFDERSETVVNRWFVGRFSRWVRLTRDGAALLATSNLGIVRIPLD